MVAYIRPVLRKNSDLVIGYALCRVNNAPSVDSDVIEHFDTDYTGKMIRESAKEFHNIADVQWGGVLYC